MAAGSVKSDKSAEQEGEKTSKRDMVGDFFKKNINKGEAALKKAIGLGQTPNIVPVTEPVFQGPPRLIEVGWHPVGGLAGKWFAEDTGLGKQITQSINRYPDPTQHWAVLVGDYAHQLWMDENFHVIYTNERFKREEWRTFKVGETHFNDDAIRRTGEIVIANIREKQPAYNLITNNCQTYALQLLDAIKFGESKEFGTTLAVYERIVGPGSVKDLFSAQQALPEQQGQDGAFGRPPDANGQQQGSVSFAQQVMNDNTTQLDNTKNETTTRGMGKKDKKEEKKEKKSRSIFSAFSRK